MNLGEKNLAAEVRAITAGHKAFMQPGGWVRVKSETVDGKWYRVDCLPGSPGEPLIFICQPEGAQAFAQDHMVRSSEAGITGCMHAALAARRMEREGRAIFDGVLWRAPAAPEAPAHDTRVLTPEEGARSNFEVRCSCGYSHAIATLDRSKAEEAMARHLNRPTGEDLLSRFG